MGAWGINTFENDGALDWLGDFMAAPSEAALVAAFTEEPEPLRTGLLGRLMGKKPVHFMGELVGDHVLAAAEVAATLRGHPALTNPGELADLPPIHAGDDTASRALAAIDSILANSNLKDCWEETDKYPRWLASVDDIRARLTLPRVAG